MFEKIKEQFICWRYNCPEGVNTMQIKMGSLEDVFLAFKIIIVTLLLTSPVYAWDKGNDRASVPLGTSKPYIRAVSVNARNPAATVITYQLMGSAITSAKFYAPGIESGVSVGPRSPGRFTCTFNQRDVLIGTSNITLQYDWPSGSSSETFTVTRTSKKSATNKAYVVGMMSEETVITLRIGGHRMQENYSLLVYSINALSKSKRIRAGWTYAALTFNNGQENGLEGYGASHQYQDEDGVYLPVTMGNGTWPDLLPGDMFHWDKYQQVDSHFVRGSTLEGECGATVFYNSPNGVIPTINIQGGILTVPLG